MDVQTQLLTLYHLQQLDSALMALKKQYNALDPGRAEQRAADAAIKAHQEAEAALHATSAALHDSELEQKSVEAKTADFEKKLYSGTIHVPKELQAMQEEIEMLKRQRGRLDEKILALMDELEAQRAREAETRQARAAAEEALKTKQAAYKQAANTLVAQARELQAQRAEAVKPIPPALLKRYDSLRASKAGVAVAPLEDGNACGGCKLGLPSSLVERVQEGRSLEVCDNCGRIL
ncbi:MAG TPA: C4-type zinc ribbon domain-containing protein, partial [Chthonomonadaceae bacterium]|nr:C4-type zinc ribbon domain-containing protein [Chthonomonadaceae bacterium]